MKQIACGYWTWRVLLRTYVIWCEPNLMLSNDEGNSVPVIDSHVTLVYWARSLLAKDFPVGLLTDISRSNKVRCLEVAASSMSVREFLFCPLVDFADTWSVSGSVNLPVVERLAEAILGVAYLDGGMAAARLSIM